MAQSHLVHRPLAGPPPWLPCVAPVEEAEGAAALGTRSDSLLCSALPSGRSLILGPLDLRSLRSRFSTWPVLACLLRLILHCSGHVGKIDQGLVNQLTPWLFASMCICFFRNRTCPHLPLAWKTGGGCDRERACIGPMHPSLPPSIAPGLISLFR